MLVYQNFDTQIQENAKKFQIDSNRMDANKSKMDSIHTHVPICRSLSIEMIVQIIQIPPLDLLKRDVGLLMAADDDAGLVEGQIASDAEVQVHHAVQFGLVADVAENVLVFGRTEQLVAVRIEDDLVDRIVEAVRQLV